MARDYTAYNFNTETLDSVEEAARANFSIDILPWQHFRYIINSGTYTDKIKWLDGVSSAPVADTYLDIGKMNHEAICSLSFAAFCAANINYSNWLQFRLLIKDFYFHAGCYLDTIASLMYTLCDPYVLTATDKIETGEKIPRRRYTDWGKVAKNVQNSHAPVKHYKPIISKFPYDEIILIRHALTHSWQPPMKVEQGIVKWPTCIRKKRIFYWPHDQHDEAQLMAACPDWICVITMMREDQAALEALFVEIYKQFELDWQPFCLRDDIRIEITD